MIKLIKNLKHGQKSEMVKGCATDICNGADYGGCGATSTDICSVVDSSTCTNVDVCNSDYSGCLFIDVCNAGVDNYNCGVQYDTK